MQRTVDVTTARRQFGTLLDEVFCKGDVIGIVRKGKPLACLVPANSESHDQVQTHLDAERHGLFDQLHSLPALSMNEDPTEVLRQIRSPRRKRALKNHEKYYCSGFLNSAIHHTTLWQSNTMPYSLPMIPSMLPR